MTPYENYWSGCFADADGQPSMSLVWHLCHLVCWLNINFVMTINLNLVIITICIIRFAAITLNLGPTFLSGTMAANVNHRPREPSCPLVQVTLIKHFLCLVFKILVLQGPYRHYILNFLWILMNLMCILITLYHLVKLYRDYSTTSADSVRQSCFWI